MTQAVMRFRQGGFIEHPEDAADEPYRKNKGRIINGYATVKFLQAARNLAKLGMKKEQSWNLLNESLVKLVIF